MIECNLKVNAKCVAALLPAILFHLASCDRKDQTADHKSNFESNATSTKSKTKSDLQETSTPDKTYSVIGSDDYPPADVKWDCRRTCMSIDKSIEFEAIFPSSYYSTHVAALNSPEMQCSFSDRIIERRTFCNPLFPFEPEDPDEHDPEKLRRCKAYCTCEHISNFSNELLTVHYVALGEADSAARGACVQGCFLEYGRKYVISEPPYSQRCLEPNPSSSPPPTQH